MASSFGIAITNLTSKVGILSRKACIRLATETGEKTLAKKLELGRNPNKEEIEQIFAGILPKACRPKVITQDSEVYECLRKSGFTDEQIAKQIKSGEDIAMAAANVGNGTGKMTYWIPYERHTQIKDPFVKQYIDTNFPALIAHEMEHSLEKNCRIKDILRRKSSKFRIAFFKLFDKNYLEKVNQRQIGIHEFEGEMQKALGSTTAEFDRTTGNIRFKCKPTVEDISKLFKEEQGISLEKKLRMFIRDNYATSQNQGSETNKRYKLLKFWMDMERPAYEVGGQIERKIAGLKEDQYALDEMVAKGYEAAIDIAKQERRTYWKNKLLGRLKKPSIYLSDKDILKHAANKEEKQILTNIIKDMSVEQKKSFIKVLSSLEGQPNGIKVLNQFIEKTTIDGKNFWLNSIHKLVGINPEMFNNPDFIKIAKITNKDGLPVYEYAMKDIANAKPEIIKRFAQIAGENYTQELNVNGMNVTKQNFIYEYLVCFLDSPNFNELKAFCEIKVDGKTPYCDLLFGLSKLPPERIKANLELAQKSAKEGKSVFQEICHEIEEFFAKT